MHLLSLNGVVASSDVPNLVDVARGDRWNMITVAFYFKYYVFIYSLVYVYHMCRFGQSGVGYRRLGLNDHDSVVNPGFLGSRTVTV